jgi:hypothetical protein
MANSVAYDHSPYLHMVPVDSISSLISVILDEATVRVETPSDLEQHNAQLHGPGYVSTDDPTVRITEENTN